MTKQNNITARQFLLNHVSHDAIRFFGTSSPAFLEKIADMWMDDRQDSQFRIDEIRTFLPQTKSVLDMASGCGTFVFGALLNGYKAYGIEPEQWKNALCQLKIREKNYAIQGHSHFLKSVGETLPFKDNSFDCVSSYQTLEHVQNIALCIDEMLRVTRCGGGLHIRCPDYRSTYEGHYLLPWLPFMPRFLARGYLKLLKRPLAGLDTLTYTSKGRIIKILKKCSAKKDISISIINLNRENYKNKLNKKGLPNFLILLYPLLRLFAYIRYCFKADLSVGLIVKIDSK